MRRWWLLLFYFRRIAFGLNAGSTAAVICFSGYAATQRRELVSLIHILGGEFERGAVRLTWWIVKLFDQFLGG